MSIERRFSVSAILLAAAAVVCPAQVITSAHSGTLHYSEGDVSIDGVQFQQKVSKFPEIKEQSVLRTGRGRAEVLLTPGVFLRLGENSAIRMLDTRLVSTRVDVLSGVVTVESDDPQMSIKDSPVTLIYKDYEIKMIKHGLLEITSDPEQMKVFKGEAEVSAAGSAGSSAVVREGRLLPFSAGLTTEKFDPKAGDDLYLWARDRSGDLSAANMSSARSLSATSGYANNGGAWNGGWYFNPYFDMYTYVPGAGTLWNPFGYGFFSPNTIYGYYTPTNYWYGGGAARGGVAGQAVPAVSGPSTRVAAPLASLRSSGFAGGSARSAIGAPIGGGALSAPVLSGASTGSSASSGGSARSAMGSGGLSAGGARSGGRAR